MGVSVGGSGVDVAGGMSVGAAIAVKVCTRAVIIWSGVAVSAGGVELTPQADAASASKSKKTHRKCFIACS